MDRGLIVALGLFVVVMVWGLLDTWIRAKLGSDKKDAALPAARQVELLTNENAALKAQVIRLEDRLATVERIVTDPATRVAYEIETLRR